MYVFFLSEAFMNQTITINFCILDANHKLHHIYASLSHVRMLQSTLKSVYNSQKGRN